MTSFIRIDRFSADAFKNFDGSEVVVTPDLVLFWRPPNPFGQWTKSPFCVDGKAYSCAEQYMMAEKARLFDDPEMERQIMETDNPRDHKKFGQKVKGFDQERWTAERSSIVYRGNMAKFSQNVVLRDLLLETGDRTLVEASPLDKIWGIGMAADNPLAYDRKNWSGLNLLGNALEKVRAELRNQTR